MSPPEPLSGRALTGLVAESGDSAAETGDRRAMSGNSRRLNAHSVHNLLTQANLFRMRGQFTEAIDCCVAVLRVQSANATAHSLLGDIYRDQGKADDAIQWYHMALDLRPNPSDQTKLAELERERKRGVESGRGGRKGLSGVDPLAAATGLSTGTSNLMGLSPRHWLRGIWIVSLSFLSIVLVALIAMRSPQGRNTRDKSKSGIAISAVSASAPTTLPPLNSRRTAMVGATPVATNGLPTDPSAAASQFQRLPQRGGANMVPTAPVIDVRPMPTPAEPGASDGSRAPRDGSIGDLRNALEPMALTGNLSFGEVRYIGNNTAAVFINAPQELAADFGDSTRELLIRNVYRAARTVFAQNTGYARLTVFVQAPVPAAGGDAVVLEAGVDRQAATAAAPDTDTLNSLVARLQSVKWAAPLSIGNPPAGEISVGTTSSTNTTGVENPLIH